MDLKQATEFLRAGVIALYERSSNSMILTKRNEKLRNHPGEVCFPGGVWEEGDNDLYATALRELHEELGIESSRVRLIKKLSPVQTRLGTFIYPWLAEVDTLEPLLINIDEVDFIISIPLDLVQASHNYKDITIEHNGMKFKASQFMAHEEFIWGATARIMKQLIAVAIDK